MTKEVDVAGTALAAPEGGPRVHHRKFLKSRLQMLQSEVFCGLFCPCDIIFEYIFQSTFQIHNKKYQNIYRVWVTQCIYATTLHNEWKQMSL